MFEQLAAESGFPRMLFQNIADAADQHYSQHQYHNKEHAHRVCDTALNLAMSDSQTASCAMPLLSLGLAARWHDAIYVPRAQGDANEQCSAAQLLMDAYREMNCAYYRYGDTYGLVANVVQHAAQMVRGTSISYHLNPATHSPWQSLLLDADLVSLSDPWPDFVDTQAAIAAEQEPLGDPEASKEFLSKFLKVRPTIYRTERAIAMYEDQARTNIKRWCGIKD